MTYFLFLNSVWGLIRGGHGTVTETPRLIRENVCMFVLPICKHHTSLTDHIKFHLNLDDHTTLETFKKITGHNDELSFA